MGFPTTVNPACRNAQGKMSLTPRTFPNHLAPWQVWQDWIKSIRGRIVFVGFDPRFIGLAEVEWDIFFIRRETNSIPTVRLFAPVVPQKSYPFPDCRQIGSLLRGETGLAVPARQRIEWPAAFLTDWPTKGVGVVVYCRSLTGLGNIVLTSAHLTSPTENVKLCETTVVVTSSSEIIEPRGWHANSQVLAQVYQSWRVDRVVVFVMTYYSVERNRWPSQARQPARACGLASGRPRPADRRHSPR